MQSKYEIKFPIFGENIIMKINRRRMLKSESAEKKSLDDLQKIKKIQREKEREREIMDPKMK